MVQVLETPHTLREANCEIRRQKILEAARELIVSEGTQAVTMRRLAKEAGLSVTTLYNLIGGRDRIVSTLVSDGVDRIDEVLEREAPLDNPLERCRAIVTMSIRHIVENEDVFRPLALSAPNNLSEFAAIPPLDPSEDERQISKRAAAMQSVAIREAISQGLLVDLLDPDCLGAQIYHGWEAAFFQWGRGILDEAGFRARALYGLYVALLGISTDQSRPMIESELNRLERAEQKPSSSSE